MLHWQGETAGARVFPFPAAKDAAAHSVNGLLDLIGTCMNFSRNTEIFGEGDPADYLYKVVSGVVRICKLMSDGRRQIGAFYLPGEVFGLEAEEAHRFSAEAIGDCRILVVKRSLFLAKATRECAVVAELWSQTMADLQQARNHMLLLGRKNAQERIAAFLLEMAERLSRTGEVELPMSRQDIADYLGLTIETVSRTLTQLERDGLIAIPVSRRIVFRDRAALDVMNDCLAA
jgi:CRP/FNR family transcriptional regulator, nitrogen fixation regulation protein